MSETRELGTREVVWEPSLCATRLHLPSRTSFTFEVTNESVEPLLTDTSDNMFSRKQEKMR